MKRRAVEVHVIDDICRSCHCYSVSPKRVTMDAYNDHDEEHYCSHDFICYYRDDDTIDNDSAW